MNRKRVVLAALLGVLAVCLLYAYLATPRLEKAPPRAESQRPRGAVRTAADGQASPGQERIDFAFLTAEPEEFPGARRDIFRFGQRRPQPGEERTPTVKTESPQPVAEVAVMPMPIEVVEQALAQFTFLGFLEKSGEKTVFLSSGGNLFLAKRGERFGAKREFLVADIRGNLLSVRHDSRDGLIEIPLIERQKLAAAVSAPAQMPAMNGSGQPGPRVFTPQRRPLQPAIPEENVESDTQINEETNPEQGQEPEMPGEGDAAEGDVNGDNQ